MRNVLILNGKLFTPIFTAKQAGGKKEARGCDQHGDFIACLLDNKSEARLAGWYILISPEDLELFRTFTWCGNIPSVNGDAHVTVRRHVVGFRSNFHVVLHHDIWKRMTGADAPFVYRRRHQLDFRRSNLTLDYPHNNAESPMRMAIRV